MQEIIKYLDDFVSTRAMGCYAWEEATRPNDCVNTPFGQGGTYYYTIQQSRKEIYKLIEILLGFEPRDIILETGAGEWGATHYLWRALFDRVITVECSKPIIDKLSYPVDERSHFIIKDSRQALDDVLKITDQVDVLFLDSDHTYQVLYDEYKLYYPLVRNGGMIIFHDSLSPLHPDVNIFLQDLVKGNIDQKFHELQTIDNSPGLKIGISYEYNI